MPAAHAAPLRAAVFDFEFVDTSPEPPRPDEEARLRRLDQQLRDLLARSGQYQPVDLGAVATAARAANLRECDCDVAFARQIGADVSVTGWVQKVSNLILNINAVIRDVPSGRVVRAGSVDIRGNTDESWSRGLAYLVENRLLTPPGGAGSVK